MDKKQHSFAIRIERQVKTTRTYTVRAANVAKAVLKAHQSARSDDWSNADTGSTTFTTMDVEGLR